MNNNVRHVIEFRVFLMLSADMWECQTEGMLEVIDCLRRALDELATAFAASLSPSAPLTPG
eukprot:3934122-Rhodomonas_salina.2